MQRLLLKAPRVPSCDATGSPSPDAEDATAAYSYGRSDLEGDVSVNGKPSDKGLFPLVIFSHGYGGCGLKSVFFTEEMARHGYVVAAPDHNDALSCTVQKGE